VLTRAVLEEQYAHSSPEDREELEALSESWDQTRTPMKKE